VDFKRYVREHLPPLTIQREPEIVDELALHLAELYREARSAGFDPASALARAAAALPRDSAGFARELESASTALPDLIAGRWRAHVDGRPLNDASGRWSILADLRRDLRYAVRMLARTPGFTFVVCLTLALGIGANTVIFTAIDAVLLQRAPVTDPDSVVSVYTASADGRNPFSSSSYPDFLDLRASGALHDVAAFASIALVLDTGGMSEPLAGELVSGNFFEVLGVRVPYGRAFLPEEDLQGSPVRVVVISHGMWMNRLGGNPSAVGASVNLNGHSYTVVGVAPRGFTGPVLGRVPELWAPMALQLELRPPSAGLRRALGGFDLLGIRNTRWLNLVGRLSGPEALEAARASADVLALNLEQQYASNRGRRFTIIPLGEGPGLQTSARPMLRLLAIAVGLVLLIACANVAGLLVVRAVSRRREVAVRMAVGAGRARLVRQWLTEAVLLALMGSLGGLLIGWLGTPLLYEIGLPETVAVGLDTRVFLFTLVVAVGSGLLFGVAPVVQTLRRDTVIALRDEGGSIASGAGATRLRSGFVVLQVALSLVLLVGAGLFLQTLRNATSVDLGYDVDRVLLAGVNLDVRGYSQEAGQSIYAQVLEKVNAVPGVTAAGAARVTVLSGSARTLGVSTDGLPVAPDRSNALTVRANVISDRYLEAMGIQVTRGRNLLPSDTMGALRVAIVSDSLAARLYPGLDPVGRPVVMGDEPVQIVGVVPDTVYHSTTERNPPPFIYVPLAQNYESGVTLHVRVANDPRRQIAALRRALREVDPQLVLERPRLLRDEFDASIGDQRLMATLVGLFGVVALGLAVVGLYGVMSHLAGQRQTEIGIRMALGAEPAAILRLMLTDGLRLVAIGSGLGLAGAFAGARSVQHQLFGVESTDPTTFVTVCGILLAVGAVACFIPARRAMRTNPSVVLRAS
jgi:predicted permease